MNQPLATTMDAPISISVPAEAGSIPIVRAVAAAVAARANLTIDDVDDVRLAVDEAAASLVSLRPSPDRLVVELGVLDGRLEVCASVTWHPGADVVWPPEHVENTLAWQVLSALVGGLSMARDGHSEDPTIRFWKPL